MATTKKAAQQLARLSDLPKGHTSSYSSTSPLPAELDLLEGNFKLKQPGKRPATLKGALTFNWFPWPRVQFEGSTTAISPVLALGEAELIVPSSSVRSPVIISQVSLGRHQFSGLAPGVVRFGRNQKISTLVFHVPNFHNYLGESVCFGSPSSPIMSASRIRFSDAKWVIEIDQQPGYTQLRKLLSDTGGFGIGHVGVAKLKDGKRFGADETGELVTRLLFFLSFLRGRWCSPVIPIGRGVKADIWTEWGPWRVSPWKDVASWFPVHNPAGVDTAYQGFSRLSDSSLWKGPLRSAIHWYVEANSNAGALEGSLVFAQTALELLGWVHLVDEKGLVSHKGFDRLPAADKLRILVSQFAIPTDIPTSFTDLHAAKKILDADDGPEVITAMRNSIIHPMKKKRDKLDKTAHDALAQALQLALTYLELFMLGLFGYQGQYVRRDSQGTMTTKVPWVTP